jgi:GNAT superfamily N-acetyltransferase
MGSFAALQVRAETLSNAGPWLGDCHAFSVKRVGLDQAEQLAGFFSRLDPEARRRRFGHAITNDALRLHVMSSLASASCIFGAYRSGHLRGAIEVFSSPGLRWAEAGLVVEREWRRQGAAWALLQEAKMWASQRETSSLRLIFARDNWPMRHLAEKANSRIDIVLDEMCAEVPAAIVS